MDYEEVTSSIQAGYYIKHGITINLYVHTTEEEKLKEIELVADALKVV